MISQGVYFVTSATLGIPQLITNEQSLSNVISKDKVHEIKLLSLSFWVLVRSFMGGVADTSFGGASIYKYMK